VNPRPNRYAEDAVLEPTIVPIRSIQVTDAGLIRDVAAAFQLVPRAVTCETATKRR